MGQLLNGSGGGSRLKYNLFVQPTEPDVKNGLWIQAPEKGFEDVIIKPNFFISETIVDDSICEFTEGNHTGRPRGIIWMNYCKDNRYIYGCRKNGGIEVVKYDILENTYTTIQTSYGNNISYYNCSMLQDSICISYVLDNISYIQPFFNVTTETISVGSLITLPSLIQIDSYGCFIKSLDAYNHIVICYNGNNVYLYSLNSSTNTLSKIGTDVSGKGLTFHSSGEGPYLAGSQRDYNWAAYALGRSDNTAYYNGCIYLFLACDIVKIHIATDTWEIFSIPYGTAHLWFSPSVQCGNKMYFSRCNGINNYSSVYCMDLDTDTIFLIGTTVTGYIVTDMAYISGHGIALMSRGYTYNQNSPSVGNETYKRNKQIALTSESQNSGTLCIQSGAKYGVTILNTKKLYGSLSKYTNPPIEQAEFTPLKDFSFFDAWYYDTDFKEYPTYIGNGSTWTKIKN